MAIPNVKLRDILYGGFVQVSYRGTIIPMTPDGLPPTVEFIEVQGLSRQEAERFIDIWWREIYGRSRPSIIELAVQKELRKAKERK